MKEELKDFGLTENECRVYLALLEMGETTLTPLKNQAELHSSRVYEALDGLMHKGLVSYFLKNNVRHFKAFDPDVLFDILDEKRERLIKAMPQIKQLQKKTEQGYSVSVYEGYKALRQIYDHMLFKLKQGQEILVVGAQPASSHLLAKTFFLQYTQRRIKKKVGMRIIFNYNAKPTAKLYAKMPFTKVRLLPKNTMSPAAMDIYPDRVSILVLKEKPVVFQLDCREVAESYRLYFNFLWNSSLSVQ